jgi:hypothetical protein
MKGFDTSVIQTEKLNSYVLLLEEVKKRQFAVGTYLDGTRSGIFPATTAESVGLQFRKIFELIAFGSLLMNLEAYSQAFPDYRSNWELSKIVKNLKKVNPLYYPKPIVEKRSLRPGIKANFRDRKADFLSAQELVEAHGKCGDLLHSRNPFKPEMNYESFWKLFPRWNQRVVNLLTSHTMTVKGFDGFYLIHMKEEFSDNVMWTPFGVKSGLLDAAT